MDNVRSRRVAGRDNLFLAFTGALLNEARRHPSEEYTGKQHSIPSPLLGTGNEFATNLLLLTYAEDALSLTVLDTSS